jgi:hypothetical protein
LKNSKTAWLLVIYQVGRDSHNNGEGRVWKNTAVAYFCVLSDICPYRVKNEPSLHMLGNQAGNRQIATKHTIQPAVM